MGDLRFALKTRKFQTEINIPVCLFGKYDAGSLADLLPSKNMEESKDGKKRKTTTEDKFGIASGLMLLTAVTLSALNVK